MIERVSAHVGRASGFGTGAVFWTTLSTILGAILFLRLGYAVANVGLLGTLAIIVLGHLVTVPAALAIAEIATNQRVAGGGVYFMLSRSFGLRVGGSIGIALYLSQTISIAFYVIAFGEAFRPLFGILVEHWPWLPPDARLFAVPCVGILWIALRARGARLGLSMLTLVAVTLLVSLALFFAGPTQYPLDIERSLATLPGADPFFYVFAICFPAFTGLTAGVGLSGDLRNPKFSIPLGTLAAVGAGFLVYVFVAVKLTASASLYTLDADPLAMSGIALWAPIIPIGLACATFSSALGSILVAPRTLQALVADGVLPFGGLSAWLRRVRASDGEPLNAAALTTLIALVFVVLGDIDSVAQIITMFFLITYGAICAVSLLERFAGDPTYRPAFHSRWYVSFLGAVLAGVFMFQISAGYAILATALLALIYALVRTASRGRSESVELLRGALFQASRWIQLRTQHSMGTPGTGAWRPSAICLSDATFQRRGALDFMRWIAHRHGFATYIHFINGFLSRKTSQESKEALARLIKLVGAVRGNVQVDTMVSPSYTSAFTQLIQLPSSSGMENNLVIFEYEKADPSGLDYAVEHLQLATSTGFDVLILGLSQRAFGGRREIHLWLPPGDYGTANLMILLSYILAHHPDWKKAEIKVFDIVSEEDRDARAQELRELVRTGRLPISERNVEVIVPEDGSDRASLVNVRSRDADFTLIGLRREAVRRIGADALSGYDGVGNVGFVIGVTDVEIERDEQTPEAEDDAAGDAASEAPAEPPSEKAAPPEAESDAGGKQKG
ncbi:MAG TPA: amino acid permease [Myxococcota bacterium]